MKEEKNQLAVLCGFLVLAMIVPAVLWNGWLMSIMWGWFIVPLGVAKISIFHASGLVLMLSMITSNLERKKSGKEDALGILLHTAGSFFLTPAVSFAIGWAYHCFM